MKRVGILGLWHLGCTYSACLADLGFSATGFDTNKKVVSNLRRGILPIFEPGLEKLTKKHLGKNLNFTDSVEDVISGSDYVFMTLDIPVDRHDTVVMSSFNRLVKDVEKYLQAGTVLTVSSQVPVGTCRDIEKSLRKQGKKNAVLCLPENLRLGQAIDGFMNPDRIVLGGEQGAGKQFLSDFSFLQCPVLEMSLESAEMSKHALNSFLALMISFSSEIGDLCEKLGANANDVVNALKLDQRVSPKAPISPGLGFAGGTLGRDLQTLKMISRKIKYKPKLISAVYEVNLDRIRHLMDKMSGVLGNLKGKSIGLLGLTYKPNTSTLRRSQSLGLADLLAKEGAFVRAVDPGVGRSEKRKMKSLKVYEESEIFWENLDAIVLMTGWEEFKRLNPKVFSHFMKQKIVFDTKNFLNKEAYEKTGFLYVGIGNGEESIKVSK